MCDHFANGGKMISIPALREEGDATPLWPTRRFFYFYPRPPRGGRRECIVDIDSTAEFLSPPSARRATILSKLLTKLASISIPALREEGDAF